MYMHVLYFDLSFTQIQMPQLPQLTMGSGSPFHQPMMSHTTSRLTIDSDSDEPDTGDAVDSATSAKRFLFQGRHRESSQQPEFERQHQQLFEQMEG